MWVMSFFRRGRKAWWRVLTRRADSDRTFNCDNPTQARMPVPPRKYLPVSDLVTTRRVARYVLVDSWPPEARWLAAFTGWPCRADKRAPPTGAPTPVQA